jgi:hypothetical protein
MAEDKRVHLVETKEKQKLEKDSKNIQPHRIPTQKWTPLHHLQLQI